MTQKDKKHFEKAMHQLDNAFDKAKEVSSPVQKKMTANRVRQTKISTLDNLPNEKKHRKELKLEMPSPITEQPKKIQSEPIKPTEPTATKVIEKQPDLEIKKITQQKNPQKDTNKEKVPFDNSFSKAVERLAKKKQQIPDKQVVLPQKTEPQREVKVTPRSDIDSSNIDSSNKQTFQETLENSLCLALNKILQNQPSADIPLPEEFYQDSKMVLKNRISVKKKLSQLSDIKIDFYVQLGEMNITLGDLLDFKEGSILETEIAVSTPLNCYANKKFLGRGELVFKDYTAGFKLNSFTE